MPQKIALIICANPKNQTQPSVYISSGKWAPNIEEVVDSTMQILIEEPIFSDNWIPYHIENGFVVGPGNFMVQFTKVGTEKQITIMLERKED